MTAQQGIGFAGSEVKMCQEILPRLEQADFVFRYSWFITRFKENSDQQEVEEQEDDWFLDPVNSLLRRDSAELSEVGILYNSL